jgi:hypothetical protein
MKYVRAYREDEREKTARTATKAPRIVLLALVLALRAAEDG